jgi:hypothetical protein
MNSTYAEHEVKYVASCTEVHDALFWLNKTCKPDPLYPRSIVNSIYFDTLDFKALYEKINSDFIKTKFRIRWYENIGDNNQNYECNAEIKIKIGACRKKIRIKSPHSKNYLSEIMLEDPSLLKIPFYSSSKKVWFNDNLIPLFLIKYERHRFIEPLYDYRVCLDFNISVPKVNRLIIPDANIIKLKEAVFEIKGATRSIPESLFFLTDLGFRKSSFSKFGRCYQSIRHIDN